MKNFYIVVSIIVIIGVTIKAIGVIGFLKKMVKFMTPIAIIFFNVSKISIIGELSKIFNFNIDISGTAKVTVDLAIIAIIFTVISDFLRDRGKVIAQIRNDFNLDIYKIKERGNNILRVNIIVNLNNDLGSKIIRRFGNLQLVIKNTDWTSISIDKEEQYEYIDSSNSSKKILIDLNNQKKIYLNLYVLSKKTIDKDGDIEFELQHSNKYVNKVLELLIDKDFNKQAIVYREER